MPLVKDILIPVKCVLLPLLKMIPFYTFPLHRNCCVYSKKAPCSAAFPSASPSRREIVFMGVSELGIIAGKAQRGPNARKFSGTQQHIIRLWVMVEGKWYCFWAQHCGNPFFWIQMHHRLTPVMLQSGYNGTSPTILKSVNVSCYLVSLLPGVSL